MPPVSLFCTVFRMIEDLNQPGNLAWVPLDHPSRRRPVSGQRVFEMNLNDGNNQRYLTVCLKVKSRLEDLIEWIEADKQQIKKMKVLVIDDEADQAGVSTGDVYTDEDRKTINRLILNLVNCRNKEALNEESNTYTSHYQAMNYISYTATPYANCLNEMGPNTLYPEHFIRTLEVSNSYFGPGQIFGAAEADADVENGMNIIREIRDADIDQIHDIENSLETEIPKSLQEAILWFICSIASLRFYGYRKPVSMLVHTSQKQTAHKEIADAIENWICENRDQIPAMCCDLYNRERVSFTKSDLNRLYTDYEYPNDEIWDYPDYNDILPYIKELVQDVSPILLDENNNFKYQKHIHLCIDNCASNYQGSDNYYVRLAYPDENESKDLGFATAFIVVGGNTLSRGLTLEGLVSTYFLRTVKQADTLMQMGRWFGYRRHYELYPRIWMTSDTKDKFELLRDIDDDLREQICEMQEIEALPGDFYLTLITSPRVSWLRLTSRNKMQMAIPAGVDFTGTDTQLVVYDNNLRILRGNLKVAQEFIKSLGAYRTSEVSKGVFIWDEVSFLAIKKGFFDAGFKIAETSRSFQRMDLIEEWVQSQTSDGKIPNWRVLLCGKQTDGLPEEQIWRPTESIAVGKVNRSSKSENDEREKINIGVLTAKKDYIADITQDMLSESDWESMLADKHIATEYRMYRKKAGVDKTPLFLIYLIDKNSQPTRNSKTRFPLNIKEDAVGIAMVIPGIRGKSGVTRVKIDPIEMEVAEGE